MPTSSKLKREFFSGNGQVELLDATDAENRLAHLGASE